MRGDRSRVALAMFSVGVLAFPTFLSSMLGYNVTSEPLEMAFYAVSGGAILYVISEVWGCLRQAGEEACLAPAEPPGREAEVAMGGGVTQ